MTKYYLWWWVDVSQWKEHLEESFSVLQSILEEEKTQELLYIPFARTWLRNISRKEFNSRYFQKRVEWRWIRFIDWTYRESYEASELDTVFIAWWNDTIFLIEQCRHPIVYKTLTSSRVVMWESAWAFTLWKYYYSSVSESLCSWLWLVDACVEVHYNHPNRKESFSTCLELSWPKHWVWIEENTYVSFKNWKFGKKYGKWEIKIVTL